MKWNFELSGEHLAIAESVSRNIGILAGPGTGKTSYGLMRRVARLLSEGVEGERILLLSFTRVAAADLSLKIINLGLPEAESVVAKTLHSYCFGLLQKESVLTLTHRNPRVLLAHEEDLLLHDLSSDYGNMLEKPKRLEAFVAGWARNESDYPGFSPEVMDQNFENDVIKWLREHHAMLIGEVVPLAFKYLRDNPSVLELYSFDHVIVDEYQDLNLLEQELLNLLSYHGNLCVAGDDDQSIYSMRYANPSGIINFINRDDVEEHEITVCGRCPNQILQMANSVISNSPNRQKAILTCLDSTSPASVALIQWNDLDSEINGLVEVICRDISKGLRKPGEILILTNWRLVGEKIRKLLGDAQVPAQTYFSEGQLTSEHAKKSFALLRLLANPSDLVAYRVLFGLGDPTKRSVAYSKLRMVAQSRNCDVLELLEHILTGAKIEGLRIPAIVKIYSATKNLLKELNQSVLPDIVERLFPPNNDDCSKLREIALSAELAKISPSDLLRDLVGAITQDEVPQDPEFIRIMSLHKSKGLTSPSVYIVGCISGVLPTIIGKIEEREKRLKIEEGRRLFYVALTRSSNELVISSSISIKLGDARARGIPFNFNTVTTRHGEKYVRTIASPYISELGSYAPASILGVDWLTKKLRKADEKEVAGE